MNNFPLYFYPTTIFFIDDNERFLQNNILGLDPKYRYQQYIEPEIALATLVHHSAPIINETDIINPLHAIEELDDATDPVALAVNLKPISTLQTNPDRYSKPSVIAVDYAMPSMNGLELCQKLKDNPVKKIMITGQADHRLAVEAFNAGVIDYFILKDEVDFYKKLNAAIDRLYWQYFIDQSRALFESLMHRDTFCLSNTGVQSFLKHYINEQKISEAYLIDSSGSYTVISEDGKKWNIIVKATSEMNDVAQMASLQTQNDAITEKLFSHSHMVVFRDDSDYNLPVDAWDKLLYPCQPIDAEKRHFFTIIDANHL